MKAQINFETESLREIDITVYSSADFASAWEDASDQAETFANPLDPYSEIIVYLEVNGHDLDELRYEDLEAYKEAIPYLKELWDYCEEDVDQAAKVIYLNDDYWEVVPFDNLLEKAKEKDWLFKGNLAEYAQAFYDSNYSIPTELESYINWERLADECFAVDRCEFVYNGQSYVQNII
jgi:hypothetical protein